MILIRLRCEKCGNLLRRIDEREVPDPLVGVIEMFPCTRCYLPKAITRSDDPWKSAELLAEFATRGSLLMRLPWESLRVELAKAAAERRALSVSVAARREAG